MSSIQIQDRQGVRIITLNRPEKRNALNLEMYSQLTEYLIQGERDNGIHAFVIKGQSDCFTSGNDVSDFLKNSNLGSQHPAFQFLFTLLDLNKPIVAAVNGPAIGIGTTLLLHCDLIYAAPEAQFQLPFVNLALVPEAGSSMLLSRLVGPHKAAELLLLGDTFGSNEAYTMKLVNRIIETEQLEEYAISQAVRLAQQAPQALQASRRLMRHDKEELRTHMQAELQEFAIRLQSDEAKAKFHAFLSR